MFFALTPDYIRAGALALSSYTGWAKSEIFSMPVSEFVYWLEGLPK
ncbi:MAG: hypothetical protein LBG61_06750 [Burkholderiales bacterium]|jgi:hypothetical protein|nr:hypothetical protein [Burkholderiales bacterium]